MLIVIKVVVISWGHTVDKPDEFENSWTLRRQVADAELTVLTVTRFTISTVGSKTARFIFPTDHHHDLNQ